MNGTVLGRRDYSPPPRPNIHIQAPSMPSRTAVHAGARRWKVAFQRLSIGVTRLLLPSATPVSLTPFGRKPCTAFHIAEAAEARLSPATTPEAIGMM